MKKIFQSIILIAIVSLFAVKVNAQLASDQPNLPAAKSAEVKKATVDKPLASSSAATTAKPGETKKPVVTNQPRVLASEQKPKTPASAGPAKQ